MLEPDDCQPAASANAGRASRLQSGVSAPAWLRFTLARDVAGESNTHSKSERIK